MSEDEAFVFAPAAGDRATIRRQAVARAAGVANSCVTPRRPNARPRRRPRLESGRWSELGVFDGERDARIEPFTDAALDVARWWA